MVLGVGGTRGWWYNHYSAIHSRYVIPRKPNEDTAPFLYQHREVKTFSKNRIIQNQDRKMSQ